MFNLTYFKLWTCPLLSFARHMALSLVVLLPCTVRFRPDQLATVILAPTSLRIDTGLERVAEGVVGVEAGAYKLVIPEPILILFFVCVIFSEDTAASSDTQLIFSGRCGFISPWKLSIKRFQLLLIGIIQSERACRHKKPHLDLDQPFQMDIILFPDGNCNVQEPIYVQMSVLLAIISQ